MKAKYGIRRKLSMIYYVTISVLLILSLLLNTKLTNLEKTSMRNTLQENIILMTNTVSEEVAYVRRQIQELSYNSKICVFDTLYDQRVGTDKWLESIELFQWYFRAVCKSNETVCNVSLMMEEHNRVVSSDTMNDYLSDTERQVLLELSDSTCFLLDDTLYMGEFLQYSAHKGKSALVVSFDSDKVLKKLIPNYVRNGAACTLSFGDHIIADFGEAYLVVDGPCVKERWQKAGRYWVYAVELDAFCDAEGNKAVFKFAVEDRFLYANRYLQYLIWMVVQILLSFTMLIIYKKFEQNHVEEPLLALLNQYEKNMTEIGHAEILPLESSGHELENVMQSFVRLMMHYKESVEKEYRLQMNVQDAEIRYLQKQLDPHFLYNCFYNIYRMCRNDGCDRAADFAMKLSGYYSYITKDEERNTVFLAEEFEHVLKYLEIQKERFRNRLELDVVQIDESYRTLIVPKLFLQPVVENCIKYVVERDDMLQTVKLCISSHYDNEALYIWVEDNGTMITDEQLGMLVEKLAKDTSEGTGLMNVKRRLTLMGSGTLEVSRSAFGGLRVTIKLDVNKCGKDESRSYQ